MSTYDDAAPVLVDGFGLSKAGDPHNQSYIEYNWIPEISKLISRFRPELGLMARVQ